MVGQCANPSCTAIFRSLHQGKLFVVAPQQSPASGEQTTPTHVWLCPACSRTMTVTVKDGQVRATANGAGGGKPAAAAIAFRYMQQPA